MKIYLEYNKPFYQRFIPEPTWRWPKVICLNLGLSFGWSKHSFRYPSDGNYFYPKTDKEGIHLFHIRIVTLYWSYGLCFYKPQKI